MSSIDLPLSCIVNNVTERFFGLSAMAAWAAAATLGGDIVFAIGLISSETVTSSVGAVMVVLSSTASFYFWFKQKYGEVSREQKVRDREAFRQQRIKDLQIKGLIDDTSALKRRIADLEAENAKLKANSGPTCPNSGPTCPNSGPTCHNSGPTCPNSVPTCNEYHDPR